MTIEDFLKRFVEGYLFHDLENMVTLKPLKGQDDGAAGYPMIMTTLAGVELLGGLISPTPFNQYDGNNYFLDYWDRCLSITNPDYENLGKLFRQLVRHGLAHSFLAKHGVFVTKMETNSTSPKFQIDLQRKEIYIDCIQFFLDFKKSYETFIQPVAFSSASLSITSKATMQQRLDEMDQLYENDSVDEFNNYASTRLSSTGTTPNQVIVGASMPISNASTSMSVPTTGVPMTTTSGTLPHKK